MSCPMPAPAMPPPSGRVVVLRDTLLEGRRHGRGFVARVFELTAAGTLECAGSKRHQPLLFHFTEARAGGKCRRGKHRLVVTHAAGRSVFFHDTAEGAQRWAAALQPFVLAERECVFGVDDDEELGASFQLVDGQGVVSLVKPGSVAAAKGVRVGDIVTRVGGGPRVFPSLGGFVGAVKAEGRPLALRLARKGVHTHTFTTGTVGLKFRAWRGLAVVTTVQPDGQAALAGVQPGDVIVEVNGDATPVADDVGEFVAFVSGLVPPYSLAFKEAFALRCLSTRRGSHSSDSPPPWLAPHNLPWSEVVSGSLERDAVLAGDLCQSQMFGRWSTRHYKLTKHGVLQEFDHGKHRHSLSHLISVRPLAPHNGKHGLEVTHAGGVARLYHASEQQIGQWLAGLGSFVLNERKCVFFAGNGDLGMSLWYVGNDVVVASVRPCGRAATQGVRVGDFVTRVSGKHRLFDSLEDFLATLKEAEQPLTLHLARCGALTFPFTNSSSPGFRFAVASGMVVVSSVHPDGQAAAHGVQAGDVVIEVNGEATPVSKHVADFAKFVGGLEPPYTLTFKSGFGLHTIQRRETRRGSMERSGTAAEDQDCMEFPFSAD